MTIDGEGFDSGAVDQVYWKATGGFVGNGTILSRTATRIVVRQAMSGATAGTYQVRVRNGNGALSSPLDFTLTSSNFTLTVTVQNVFGGSLPTSGNGEVNLFNGSGVLIATALTDASKQVLFSNIQAGSYRYTVYHRAGVFGTREYWGERSLSVTSNTASSFVRNQPYIGTITFFNHATNQTLGSGSTIARGTTVRAQITLINPGGGAGSVSTSLLLDRNQQPSYDVSTACGLGSIASHQGSVTLSCTFAPSTAGVYYRALTAFTAGSPTDTAPWSQAFIVQ